MIVECATLTILQILGDMNVLPFFGEDFNVYFPIFILVLCLCTLFNVYSRVLAWLDVRYCFCPFICPL